MMKSNFFTQTNDFTSEVKLLLLPTVSTHRVSLLSSRFWLLHLWTSRSFFFSNFFFFFLVGGELLYNIVMIFAIHWHESAMDPHVFPMPIPPPASLPTPSLWVFPVHQPWALVSCIQPGLVICFTFDSILVSMLFSQNIPPSPSPTESKSLFYTSVSLFLFCI